MAKKRGKNEGSIFRRKDGRWCGALNLGWENGRRKRKHFYAATAAEVQDQLLKARSDKSHGLPVAVERQTVSQFLDRWLVESVEPTVRPLTYEQYAQHVRLYIDPLLGRTQLSRLSPQQVQAFINAKLNAGLSPGTIRITLFVLRRALAQAVKWDLIARNVARLVDGPRVERKEVKPPRVEEVARFLESIKGERLEAVYTVGLVLGLRRGELLGLRWEDVDFQGRTVAVKQALQRSGGKRTDGRRSKLRFVAPKSNRGIRTLPMPDRVASALRAHRARQAEDRLLAGAEWQDFGLVFATRKGTPIEPRRLDTEFKRMLRKAGLPTTIRLHDSRHFAATLLLAQGVHPRTVMEILGHSDIGLTMNTYSHVLSETMRLAAEKIDAVLGA